MDNVWSIIVEIPGDEGLVSMVDQVRDSMPRWERRFVWGIDGGVCWVDGPIEMDWRRGFAFLCYIEMGWYREARLVARAES